MQKFDALLTAGKTIKDRYIIEDVLGKGEFGTSYLVRDKRESQKLFVLKDLIIPAGKRRNRNPSEVVSLMRLNHPALPRVHQVLNDSTHDHLYILRDYIEGTSLETLQSEQPERRFSLSQFMTLLAPIISALMYLHAQKPPIIHQHIKPSNVIVSKTGTMLVDFGFAWQDNTVRYSSRGYLAPEQYSATSGVSPGTDIYALGALFYTLLTGTVPQAVHKRLTTLENKQSDPLIPANQFVPALPAAIDDALRRAMSLNKEDRFASVENLWSALWQAVIISPMVMQSLKLIVDSPGEGSTEGDADPTLQQITKPVVTSPDVEVPELFADPTEKQGMEPVIAPAEAPQTPVSSAEITTAVPAPFTPIPTSLTEQHSTSTSVSTSYPNIIKP